MQSINTLIFTLLYLTTSALSFDINSQNNIAVYWGQNSQGSQARLSEYCQSSDAGIFILSFLDIFPTSMGLNFANACSETYADNSNLLHCTQIASDIQTCQSLGKKVLLSLGGASGAYGFTDTTEAETFAQTLWDTFGEGENASTIDRPFDSTLIDGFDFDIENNNNVGYASLVNKLRELFTSQGSKQYFISAAPQCPYPDASVGDLLSNAQVDFAFIQFYNNYCNLDKQFNWNDWENYANSVSPNANIKLFLGLPGSPTAAGSGFISDLDLLQSTVSSIKGNANFGGIAIWDASQGYSYEIDGKNYIENVQDILNNTQVSSSASSTATSSSAVITHTSTTPLLKSTSTASINDITTETSVRITSTLLPVHSSTAIISNTIISERITSTLSPVTSSAMSTSTPDPVLIAETQTKEAATVLATIPHHSDAQRATTLVPTVIVDKNVINTPILVSSSVTTTSISQTTTTLTPSVTSSIVATTPTTIVSTAHEQAQQLNQLYSEGKFNGQSTCTNGEFSCSNEGKIAICNFGGWVTMECAAGTTCYSYDQDGEVFTQCAFTNLRNNFI